MKIPSANPPFGQVPLFAPFFWVEFGTYQMTQWHDFLTSHGFSTDLSGLESQFWGIVEFIQPFASEWPFEKKQHTLPIMAKVQKLDIFISGYDVQRKRTPKKIKTPGKKRSVTSLSTLSTVGLFYFLLETCFQPGRLSHGHRTNQWDQRFQKRLILEPLEKLYIPSSLWHKSTNRSHGLSHSKVLFPGTTPWYTLRSHGLSLLQA